MKSLSADGEFQDFMERVYASVLNMGNVEFEKNPDSDDDRSSIVSNMKQIKLVASLLQTQFKDLAHGLTHRSFEVMGKTTTVPLNVTECCDSRDAVSKALYQQVFSAILLKINQHLDQSKDAVRSCGVLDIFGFEKFDINYFEQVKYDGICLHFDFFFGELELRLRFF